MSGNDLRIAEAVRKACARAAADAYEDAGIRGLCAEGRWEAALDALRRVELEPLIRQAREAESNPSRL